MAITATLVEQGNNRLRYLLSCDTTGITTLNITTTGAATPDLLTDSLAGPVKNCANARNNGLGQIAAGALNQAQARAIWMADNSNAVQGTLVDRCRPSIEERSGAAGWTVDANFSNATVAGAAVIVVTADNIGTAYLDIGEPGAIGL